MYIYAFSFATLDCQFDVYGLYQIWLEEKQYPRFADLDEHYMQFSVIHLQFSVIDLQFSVT